MTQADLEFLGSEYEIGYSYGMNGWPHDKAIRDIAKQLGRGLKPHERTSFVAGMAEGQADLTAYERDQANREPALCEPLPW